MSASAPEDRPLRSPEAENEKFMALAMLESTPGPTVVDALAAVTHALLAIAHTLDRRS